MIPFENIFQKESGLNKSMPPSEKTPEKSSAGIIKGMAPLSKLNKTVLRKKIIKVLGKKL